MNIGGFMQNSEDKNSPTSSNPPKPLSENVRPQITRFPSESNRRSLVRWLVRVLTKFLLLFISKVEVSGLENIPLQGCALVVSNHLGDSDFVVGIANTPRQAILLVKSDLYDFPILGKVLDAYGVIWVHRGHPDRRAIRIAISALKEGHLVGLAPEGRESLTGALEEGTNGAAYLAIKANAQIVPITFTGTENRRVFTNVKRLRRTPMTMTVGPPFKIHIYENLRTSIDLGTQTIMKTLAHQLPPEYRGVYNFSVETSHDRE
jgi:1-acyl-sn-glycerol-3-phosphate acyltransferase